MLHANKLSNLGLSGACRSIFIVRYYIWDRWRTPAGEVKSIRKAFRNILRVTNYATIGINRSDRIFFKLIYLRLKFSKKYFFLNLVLISFKNLCHNISAKNICVKKTCVNKIVINISVNNYLPQYVISLFNVL